MMRIRLRTTVALIFCLSSPIAGQGTLPPDRLAGSGVTVSGSIVGLASSGSPKPTEVLLTHPPDVPGRLGIVDRIPLRPDGTFSFANVRPGRYLVVPNRNSDPGWEPITVGTADVTGLAVRLVEWGSLRIRARVDDDSQPPGEHLFLIRSQSRTQAMIVGPELTLPPGRFHVFLALTGGLGVAAMRVGDIDLLQSPITIGTSDSPRDLDIVLTRTPTAALRSAIVGRVEGNHPGVEVRIAMSVTLPGAVPIPSTRVAQDGSFEFRDLVPGIYNLYVSPSLHPVDTVVAVGKETKVMIAAGPGQFISSTAARVVNPSGQPLQMTAGRLELVADSLGGERKVFEIRSTGFWGTLAAGAYNVRLDRLPPGFRVRSIVAGSVDLLNNPFVVPDNRSPETIRIVLEYNPDSP